MLIFSNLRVAFSIKIISIVHSIFNTVKGVSEGGQALIIDN